MICSISHKEMSPEVLLKYHQYHMKKQYNPLALNSAKKIFKPIKPGFEIIQLGDINWRPNLETFGNNELRIMIRSMKTSILTWKHLFEHQ